MRTRTGSLLALTLGLGLATSCATGQAISKAQSAAKAGDWDTAVAAYRQAFTKDPKRVETRIALAEAMLQADAMHTDRARKLEAADQIAGAAAEYRLAADVNPADALAVSKAATLERKVRDQVEANRPKPAIEAMREQASRLPVLPVLDPREKLMSLSFKTTAVKDILSWVQANSGINIVYDQAAGSIDTFLNRPYSITLQDSSIEQALNQILSANTLFFKVIDPKTILVAGDTQQNRQRLEDQALQTFYVSNANISDISTTLTTIFTQMTTLAIRPTMQLNKNANSITVRASLPVLAIIDKVIKANDKPRAEVLLDIEVLEVDLNHVQTYGLNLNSYALGLTFSPGVAPPNVAGSLNTNPGATVPQPPPINLNTISHGVSLADFYLSVPSVELQLLESDSKSRILARPQLRGYEGQPLTAKLGTEVPVLNAQTPTSTVVGGTSAPTVSYTYQNVGVNLIITAVVTPDDQIVLDLSVENSSLGNNISVAGTLIPQITDRLVHTYMQLRDGETNLLAGLLSQTDAKQVQGLPGITNVPFLRTLLGGTNNTFSQTDIVMSITPHIVRGHGLTPEDLKPIYIGTQQNFGLVGAPSLIAPPEAPATMADAASTSAATPPQPAQPQPVPVAPPIVVNNGAGTAAPPTASGIVPLTPVAPAVTPAPAPTAGQVSVVPPGTEFSMGGGPYNVPVIISGVSQLGSMTLTVTYNPAVLRAQSASMGKAMQQGGVTPAFTPKIDQAAGRIDIVVARPSGQNGASIPAGTQDLLAGIVFAPVGAGSSPITLSGVALTSNGQPIPLNFVSTNVTVK